MAGELEHKQPGGDACEERDRGELVRPAMSSLLESGGLLGRSEVMARLGAELAKMAESDSTVLITGESGTGKELVARVLHLRSPRGSGPFIPVNCAAIPEALIESEFFGHTRGAYTGATTSAKGLFEQANGGSLFLDEIGELGLLMQPKLLRALQERKVRPVGDQREFEVDVRLIAATNRDLAQQVQEGSFRSDLFYRMNVLTICVPPLRDRGEDVLLLAEHFLALHAERSGKDVRGLSEEAKSVLVRHDWPGNVRELQSSIDRAVTLAEGPYIQPEDLPIAIVESAERAHRLHSVVGRDSLPSLSNLEWRYIHHVLDKVDGNKTQAARVLGINRRTLHRKLRVPSVSRKRDAQDLSSDDKVDPDK